MNTLPGLIPVNVTGVHKGIAMLTPDSVAYFHNPPFWAAHARIQVNLDIGAEHIYSANWTSSGRSDMIGVYKGGLIFPRLCPATLAEPETDVVAETSVVKRSLGKTQFNSKDANKIMTALACDRYWFTIPFAKNHGMKDRAIGFTSLINKNGRNNAIIMIKQRPYAQELARLNQLANGKWLSMKHILLRNIGLVFAILGAGGILGGLLANSQGTAVIDPTTIIIVAAILGVVGIVLTIIGLRGEDL